MSVQESVLERAIRERREALDELERLRAAAERMLAHHDDLVSVVGGPPLNCNEAMQLRAALTKAPR